MIRGSCLVGTGQTTLTRMNNFASVFIRFTVENIQTNRKFHQYQAMKYSEYISSATYPTTRLPAWPRRTSNSTTKDAYCRQKYKLRSHTFIIITIVITKETSRTHSGVTQPYSSTRPTTVALTPNKPIFGHPIPISR